MLMVSYCKGLNLVNDRTSELSEGKIDQHLHIAQKNRLNQHNKPSTPILRKRSPSPLPRSPTPQPPTRSPSPIQSSPLPRSPTPRLQTQEDVEDKAQEVTEDPKLASSPVKGGKLKVQEKDQPKLTIAIEVFGEPLVAQCLSKNLSQKQEGIDSLKTEIEKYTKASETKPGKFFKASSQVLLFLLKSPIWGVYQSACELTINLFEGVAEQYKVSNKTLSETTKSIFSVILSRSGEPVQRVHDLSIETGVKLVKMPKMEELDVLDELLTSPITVKEPAKVALSRVKFTRFLVEEYGISDEKNDPMCVRNLAKFGAGAVKHQDPDVRQAGQDLVIYLYRADPKTVRKVMPEDNNSTRRSHAYKYVFEEMERYDRKIRKNR